MIDGCRLFPKGKRSPLHHIAADAGPSEHRMCSQLDRMFAGRMIQAQDSSARKSGVLLARPVLSIAARVELKWSKSNLKMLCALRMTRAPAQSRTSRRRQSFVFQIPREAHLFLPAR